MSKRKTLIELQIESDLKYNGEFIILNEPKNAHHKVDIKHLKCNNILNVSPKNHLKNYCKYCSGKHKRTIEEWQLESDSIHNDEYEIIKIVDNSKSDSDIRHVVCGKIFKQSMSNHINLSQTCSYCSGRKYTLSDLQIRSDLAHNKNYKILKLPKNFKENIPIKHLKCGRVNEQTISNHILKNRGCKYCKLSKGEVIISSILDRMNIDYEIEYKFGDCENIKQLRFDFYLPIFNMCIEYDGKQHFESVEFFGGLEEFEKLKIRDNIKNTYCENNKIPLIRFKYSDTPNQIEDELILFIFNSNQ